MTRTLFSAQRNEKPFLLEWALYHRLIGFERIIVFSNQCTDGSDDLLDRMADLGLVEHHRHEPAEGVPPQVNAGRIAMEAGLFNDNDWVMWLYTDEFLNVKTGERTVQALLDAAAGADAMAVAWRVFGDGGNAIWPGRQISEKFVDASRKGFRSNTHTKTIFRFSKDIERIDIHRPVFRESMPPSTYRYVDGGNKPLPEEFVHAKYKGGIPRHVVKSKNRHGLAQINHYTVRTADIYGMKRLRGRGYGNNGLSSLRHNDKFFEYYNRNEVKDRSILRWEAPLAEEIANYSERLGDF